jgi:exodeoxyribonuclease V alpha subunit
MEYVSGIVERITYQNQENGFCVLKIRSKGHSELITVVGSLVGVHVGAVIKLKGQWKVDSKFGKQFAAVDYRETTPATIAGIEKYLGSGLIKGIGPVYAKKIVKHFREDTLRIIEDTPDKLIEVEGIGIKRIEIIKKAWIDQKEIKNVMLFLQSNGVSTAYAVKIYKTYGDNSIDIVKTNPYRLADDIWGIGFRTADKIAQQLGFGLNSYERCRAGIIYIINELANDGHCFATHEQIYKNCSEILELEIDQIANTLKLMIDEKSLIADGDDAVYLPPFYYSELGTQKLIEQLLNVETRYSKDNIEGIITSIEVFEQIEYDEVQRQAIEVAVLSKVMVLTGGPGTGKTTTTLAIIKVFEKLGAKVMLAAPTGRAAKRMSEATGMESKTVHRLLEYKPTEGYKKNEDNTLECDVLIIDEMSMVDIMLMYNLLKAVSKQTVVILVGDIDQLPSVGAGNVLRDIIDSEAVNVVKLTRIFRQAQGSAIITNAHRINKGEMPNLKAGKDSDFFYIEEVEPQQIVEIIEGLCKTRLPKYYNVNPLDDIQVLCPMQRGETGAANLNSVLQDVLNPSTISIKYGGIQYRLHDKVMQIKNNYDKNVFNGDIGRIINVDNEDRIVEINFDGNSVTYDVTELDEVVLAYATTVHKSQGSEYKIVITPFTMQHFMMLQRNLLYTCITRAKQIMILIGTKQAIAMAIKNNKITKRNTKLAQRLSGKEHHSC